MRVLRADGPGFSEAIAEAAAVLRAGGLVAFPTETVYGLGAHALDAKAVARIYDAKGRPGYNPLIVHVDDVSHVERVVREFPERAMRLAEAFWPGPLTMVLPRTSAVPDAVTAGLDTVGVRVPAHPVALALLRAADIPVAAPSANRSMAISPTRAEHVAESLGSRVDVILDGGPTDVGIESTVLDLSSGMPTILRPGMIGAEAIARVLGESVHRVSDAAKGEVARPSPGMMDRHYAPRGRVLLYSRDEESRALAEAKESGARGERVGAIARGKTLRDVDMPIAMPDDPEPYARALYDALHQLDEANCALVLIERVPDTDDWLAIRDRLSRAAR